MKYIPYDISWSNNDLSLWKLNKRQNQLLGSLVLKLHKILKLQNVFANILHYEI